MELRLQAQGFFIDLFERIGKSFDVFQHEIENERHGLQRGNMAAVGAEVCENGIGI